MTQSAYCANRLNLETGQWEYAPRYVEVEHGQVTSHVLSHVICGRKTLGPDDLIRPCVLPVNHTGFCDTGR